MRIERLSSRSDGRVGADIRLEDGEVLNVVFTITASGGLNVANPDIPVFDREGVDAQTVRGIISAVLAFEAVAANSHEDPQ